MKTNKIAFVIDGYYGLTLYKDIKHRYGKLINFEGLVAMACNALSKWGEKCISPANLRNYYMGTCHSTKDSERDEYEDALKLSKFGARGRPLQNGKEKGIDTMLYSDIKDEAESDAFDYLLLLAGDLDHITLVEDLKSIGKKTVLFYGEILANGVKTTGCSDALKSACYESVDLYSLLENDEIFSCAKTECSIADCTKSRDSFNETRTFSKTVSITTQPVAQAYEGNFPATELAECDAVLLNKVISSIREVISVKENQVGRKIPFALQAQVGIRLKEKGVELPVSLGNFFDRYPGVFRTGAHPSTHALTVSVR